MFAEGELMIEIEIYLVELHRHKTVPQLTLGFCGAQVRYKSIYKLSIYKPNTHILPKKTTHTLLTLLMSDQVLC
jgi:hypothetical protein